MCRFFTHHHGNAMEKCQKKKKKGQKRAKKVKKGRKGQKKAAHRLCGVPLPLLALGQQPRHLGTDLGNLDAQLPKVVPVMTSER
jgi:hypothetical protein